MLHYILQVIFFQLGFLIVYDLLLRKETFFNWNRAYLIVTVLLSVSIPFIKIKQIKAIMSDELIVRLPEVIIGNTGKKSSIDPEVANLAGITAQSEPTPILNIVLIIGMCIALLVLAFKIYKLTVLVYKYPKRWKGKLLIINLINSTAAFSFFHYVFLGEKLTSQDKATILEHEMIHVKEKHTLDLLLFEIFRIVFWFNPLVYIYQNRIAMLHEYIADAKAVKTQNKSTYYNNLMAQVFETKNFSFVNPFFKKSIIKKRIVMLNKTKSKQINILKYILVIPFIFSMLIYVSCEKQVSEQIEETIVNLDQFSYSLNQDEEMSEQIREIHNKYEAFLKANPDYVSWSEINHSTQTISYSVHSISEQVPSGFSEIEVSFPDGTGYKSFINFKSSEVNDTDTEVVETEAYSGGEEVPFSIVEETPTFTKCMDLSTNKERKRCMTNSLASFVNKNFDTNLATALNLEGKQRISVIFKIDTNGKVTHIKARAPHPKLEEEAKRVISMLPKLVPGKQRGEKVVVNYSLPILFQVNSDSN
ncbi:M56 family metallopeptidase [uncultured Psychroserpens sp.]|uniref:M56 family metallopeptidase n=1 Tax=uncultured Psychroserpens sp. TaxID=255436 RepID=UPI00260EE745|nr:M56 family metallopeptidase [uncultured Psychroserpens sp.]